MGSEVELWQIITLFVVGIISGFINVAAGGGSMLSVPVLIFMGVPGPVANGTNRIAILAQNITAVIAFFRKGYADLKLSLSLALATLPGAVIGAFIGARLEAVWFNRVLAIVMVLVMILMTLKKETVLAVDERQVKRLLLAHVAMFFVGFYGGFIQIGVGFILMPALQYTLGLDLVRVNMHKAFIIGMYTVVALIVFSSQLQLLWMLGLCLAVGNSIGAWLSTHVQVNKGEGYIKWVLNIVLTLFIIKLLFSS